MLKRFMPDRIFTRFSDVTPELLHELGITALLLDIDNTLVTYDDPEPTTEVLEWLESLKNEGISAAFVSNNSDPSRVERFNEKLGLFAVSRAKKPFKRGFVSALEHMNTSPSHAASLGDQIFTDVWAAKNTGTYAFLVPPIKDKTTPFFKFKRLLERPIIRLYHKRNDGKI